MPLCTTVQQVVFILARQGAAYVSIATYMRRARRIDAYCLCPLGHMNSKNCKMTRSQFFLESVQKSAFQRYDLVEKIVMCRLLSGTYATWPFGRSVRTKWAPLVYLVRVKVGLLYGELYPTVITAVL